MFVWVGGLSRSGKLCLGGHLKLFQRDFFSQSFFCCCSFGLSSWWFRLKTMGKIRAKDSTTRGWGSPQMRYDSPTRLMYILWFHHFQAFLEDHPAVGVGLSFSHGVVNFGMASRVFFPLYLFALAFAFALALPQRGSSRRLPIQVWKQWLGYASRWNRGKDV